MTGSEAYFKGTRSTRFRSRVESPHHRNGAGRGSTPPVTWAEHCPWITQTVIREAMESGQLAPAPRWIYLVHGLLRLASDAMDVVRMETREARKNVPSSIMRSH